MKTATVPSIQQQPRTVAATAIHYGYCAFKDIFVGDRRVQPAPEISPYSKVLPARQLIPFTNVEMPEVNMEVTGGDTPVRPVGRNGQDPTVTLTPKSAKACAEEIEWAYAEWGFRILNPLTGFNEQDAFEVFQTIQPFAYKLVDLQGAVGSARTRINAATPYEVEYGGEIVELQPLRSELKPVAEKVLTIMRESVDAAEAIATRVKADTIQKMEQFYATGYGKKQADPLDEYVFNETNDEIPALVAKKGNNNDDAISRLADALSSRQTDTAAVDRIAQKEAELDAALKSVKDIESKWNSKFKEKFAKKDNATV